VVNCMDILSKVDCYSLVTGANDFAHGKKVQQIDGLAKH
jgi:hypothetical protein